MKHRLLVLTGGGDCPGLNAVIRGIVKRSSKERNWEILGSYQAFNGVLRDPMELIVLDEKKVSGIHVKGGTIIGTTNKGGPFSWPVRNPDGTWTTVDRSDELIRRLQYQNIEAVINIGGDGSQRISLGLYEKGLNIIGVPKTIDNDLAGTDFTFGFQTAVEIATDAVDKLVTTAESHNRIFILEVMGRDAGWIALHAAVGGAASRLKKELKDAGCEHDIRVTILGHLQRGGIPSAYDRILATQFGVKAFEMVLAGDFGKMVSYKHPRIVSVPIKDAISVYNRIEPDDQLLHTARGIGICMGD